MTATDTTFEWAVRVHDMPGSYLVECPDHGLALLRLQWWRTNRPDARPELVRRTVVVTRGPWETP